MRETSLTIRQPLIEGARTERIGARNMDVLDTCKNLRPTEFGLAFGTPISESVVGASDDWPYPQLFKGDAVTLLCEDQTVSTVDEDTWTTTALTPYKIGSAMAPSVESVQNGDFAAGTGWTLGSGWAISGGKLTATAVTSLNDATQANVDQSSAITAGGLYRTTYTIDSISGGGVRVEVGGALGTWRTAAGTYTEDIVATSAGDIALAVTSTVTASIDDLSVKEIEVATIPSGGGGWQFAEFRDVWFLFKDNCMLAKVPHYSGFRLVSITTADDDFSCPAGASVSSRLFLGGLDMPTRLAETDWEDAWDAWLQNSSEWSDAMTYTDMTLGKNVVMYSTRVGGDINWPFSSELALLGFANLDDADNRALYKANYIDWIRRGEIGFVPLLHQGSILNLKPLGNGVVAYCEDGVSYVTPREGRGFKATVLHRAGIADKLGVAGDDMHHVFMDTHGILWKITADGRKSRETGNGIFSNIISNIDTNPLVCSYDPEEQEAYFCTDQEGYVLTRTGVGEVTNLPTGLIVAPSGLVGVTKDLGTPDIEIVTETFDMGLKALKTIHALEFAFQDITNLKVVVQFKYDNSTTFRDSAEYTVNNDGICVPVITSHDFRLKITGTPGADAKIDYINVRWQMGDKRNIRGIYA